MMRWSVVVAMLVGGSAALAAPAPHWAGKGACRMLLTVPPAPIAPRTRDEMPAEVRIDFAAALRAAGIAARPDLSTLQVMRFDERTGRPMRYGMYLYGATSADRPLQWYDDAIPEPFPDRDRSPRFGWVARAGWGRYYDAIGDGASGRLVWSHTQDRMRASHYAVYFDLLKAGQPQESPPRGWTGDGAKRNAPVGTMSTGLYHVDCQMTDVNHDGLLDLLCGSSRGGILWYDNRGTREKPRFTSAHLLYQSDGKPIDPGFLSTPTSVDWDRDGRMDLLVGAKASWVYFYRNVGTNSAPVYEDRGPLEVDGKPLHLPAAPTPEAAGPNGEEIYREDYEPFPEAVDWDGDGDMDLLVGGYVTGRLYLFENTGVGAGGVPILAARGPLAADGKPLDVGWCANPTVADIDGDGDLDVITGNWRKWGNLTPPEVVEDFLSYYENIGTRTAPVLTMKALPRIGTFPNEIVTNPTLVDWNGDGLLDLVVSSCSGSVYLFPNVGDRRHPRFDARRHEPLQMPWSNAPLPYGTELRDVTGDGIPDLLNGYTVSAGKTKQLPWDFGAPRSMLPEGQSFDHRSWQGDDWEYTVAVDFDQDGRTDVLYGDYWGHVWFHRNTSTRGKTSFDMKGVQIVVAGGEPVTVGRAAAAAYDFDTMQGPRTSLVAADFDGDGSVDMVVYDVFGHVTFCRRGTHGREPVVASQEPLEGITGYATMSVVDWDGDGRPDLLASQLHKHLLYRNQTAERGARAFAPSKPIDLPLIPVIGSVIRVFVVDANGDGDRDVVLMSDHGIDCLFERTYLDRGYARASVGALERRLR